MTGEVESHTLALLRKISAEQSIIHETMLEQRNQLALQHNSRSLCPSKSN